MISMGYRNPKTTGFWMEFSYVEVVEAGAADFIVKPFSHD
jgi:hypothetical protein